MSQVTNYAVPNGPRATVRQGFNDVLEAVRDDNAGATAPLNPVPFMRWRDTSVSPPVLRIRNAANSSWDDLGLNGLPQLAGRNLIINGDFRINQRGYVSGAATSGANQFTLDRWCVRVSGQSVTFTSNASGRTVTAPAGGLAQVIEGANIKGGSYVVNWVGAGTCAINGTARAKGATFTLPANTNATVQLVGAVTEFQLETGTVPTPFEFRSVGQELALCQRYYAQIDGEFGHDGVLNPGSAGGVTVGDTWFLPVKMRATPSVIVVNESGTQAGDIGGLSAKSGDAIFATWQWLNANVVTSRRKAAVLAADAEITP